MNPTSKSPGEELSSRTRIVLIALGLLGLVLLIVARNLEPDPRGFGTHEQLGLTPCYFHQRTGIVCPSCGMTTAWAHAMRGDLVLAAKANLGGMLLCIAMLLIAPWLVLSGFLGRTLGIRPKPFWILTVATGWVLIVALNWLQRWIQN